MSYFKRDLSNFYVITIVSNPVRYRSRYEIYKRFKEMVEGAGVKLITVEQAFGDRPFEITERDNPMHLQVRSEEELWHKENMINIGIEYMMQLDPDAKYVAWVDADVFPMRLPRDWFEETVQELQHYEFVQMFEYAQDLSPTFNPIGKQHQGFIATYIKSGFKKPAGYGIWKLGYYDAHGHPGFAWAANVEAISKVGGLIDFGILGSGDRHMAMGLIGCVEQSRSDELHPRYKELLKHWQQRADRHIRQDVGFVRGGIYHHWHGKKKHRGYSDRWRILINNRFDPVVDIKKDAQGLYRLESHSRRQIMLRDQIRSYFRTRNEDSIDSE